MWKNIVFPAKGTNISVVEASSQGPSTANSFVLKLELYRLHMNP